MVSFGWWPRVYSGRWWWWMVIKITFSHILSKISSVLCILENESSIVSVEGAKRIPLAKKRPQSIDDSPHLPADTMPCWETNRKPKCLINVGKKNLFNIRFKATLVKTEYMLLYPALSVGWIADFSDFRCLFFLSRTVFYVIETKKGTNSICFLWN